MAYLKSLFFNFLTIFFVNHLIPGIEVMGEVKLPHLGGDLLFAIILGFLNALIYPMLRVFLKRSSKGALMFQIGLIALIINFAAYAILKLISIGITIESLKGYLIASIVVSVISFCTNFAEMRAHDRKHPAGFENDDKHFE